MWSPSSPSFPLPPDPPERTESPGFLGRMAGPLRIQARGPLSPQGGPAPGPRQFLSRLAHFFARVERRSFSRRRASRSTRCAASCQSRATTGPRAKTTVVMTEPTEMKAMTDA